jgi:hypothetical protein
MFFEVLRPSKNGRSPRVPNSSTTINLAASLALLPALVFVTACAPASLQAPASSSPTNNQSTSSKVTVVVTPDSAEVSSGGNLQLTASLTGTKCTGVSWQTSAGSVSNAGLFRAPAVTAATSAKVTATNVPGAQCVASGPAASGSATITVLPAVSDSKLTITTTSLPAATTGVSYNTTMTASGGNPPYAWSSAGVPAGLSFDSSGTISGKPSQSGAYSLKFQVTDALAHTATFASTMNVAPKQNSSSGSTPSNFDGPAELPLAYVQTAMSDTPAPSSTVLVGAGGDFQTALNNAQCGDTIELQGGATFTGKFTVPAKACDDQHWIIIRTSAPDASLPAEGTRISPCYAGVASLPGRPDFNCGSTQNVLAKIQFQTEGSGPIQLQNGANHYRFIGLEITRIPGTGLVGSLISAQTAAAASDIIIDRSWLHGTAEDETNTGVALQGLTNTAIINSYLTDFHCTAKVGACTDSHAIGGGLGSLPGGPYAIVNNFLEAAGENVLFGGGPATATPADIQISQNHFFKPLLWMAGASGFIGGVGGNPFVVKNHLELKNAQRVLAEDNIFENNWGGFTQHGHSILLTPKDQYDGTAKGNTCPLCQVTDVTVRYSTVSHVGAGICIANVFSDGGGQASAGERYSIHDVVIDDINATAYNGGGGFLEFGNNWNANVLNSVTINHVTAFPDPQGHTLLLFNSKTNPTMWGFHFTNNIVNATTYPVWNGIGNPLSCAAHDVPIESLTACFNSWSFTNNVIPGISNAYPASSWPSANFFPLTDSAVQFVNYNNGNGGNYQLAPTSPYRNSASDGTDPGANIDLVNAGIAGVY